METLLRDIRETEAKAEQILLDAQEKAAGVIAQGKTDAAALIATRRQELLDEKSAALAKRAKELDKETQKHCKKAEKQAERLAHDADTKGAVSYLLRAFKEMI